MSELNKIKVNGEIYEFSDNKSRSRLDTIEYQTIGTELAYEHTDLPEGEKTITVNNDEIFGGNAYVCTGNDLIPRKTFNCTFPYNGITITKTGKTYHIEGASTASSSFTLYFGEASNDINIEIDESLIGKTLRLLSFANEPIGSKLGMNATFYDSNSIQLNRKSMYVANTNAYNSSTIVIPDNTAFMRVGLSIGTETVYNHDIQVYAVIDENIQTIDLTTSSITSVESNATKLFAFPYESAVSIKLPLTDYIKYMADNSDGGAVTYLTPEDFGAIGDGYADDSMAIALCLSTATATKQTVLMAKKYYTSLPIDITSSNLNIIINDIEYGGTDAAIIIHSKQNTINIHSISSGGIGIRFIGDGDTYCSCNSLDINSIISKSHGIEFTAPTTGVYQNTVRFNYIQAGGDGCYGIYETTIEDGSWCTENNFYGGQISNCDWAVYNIVGNSRLVSIQTENNVKGGFYITGGVTIFVPRNAEASRDGEYPYYKFVLTDDSSGNIKIIGNTKTYINEIDLSENPDYFINNTGAERPLHEGVFAVLDFPLTCRCPETGVNGNIPTIYTTRSYVWGKYLIMTPHMSYRKVITTEILDTRLIGRTEETDTEIMALTQLPTKFVVNNVNTEIYLHASYCAFGFNEFEVEQANGFTCKVYNVKGTLLFDGTEQGDGLYKFNVYKDSDYCTNNSSGLLRADFLGHYWTVTRISALEEGVNDDIALLDDKIPNAAVVEDNTLKMQHDMNGVVTDLFSVELPESSTGDFGQFIESTSDSINLYEPQTEGWLDDAYILSNGTPATNTTTYRAYVVTPEIPIKSGTTYTVKPIFNDTNIVDKSKARTYDSNGTPIDEMVLTVNEDSVTFTTPENSAIIRFTVRATLFGGESTEGADDFETVISNFNSSFMLVEGTEAPEEYIAYGSEGYRLKDIDIPDKTVNIEKISEEALPILAKLAGKKIVNFGDSIFGNARPPEDVSTYFAEKTGAEVLNCAFGGCRMSTHTGHWDCFSMYRLAYSIANNDFALQDDAINYEDRTSYAEVPLELIKSTDFSTVDILTIAYGTNDFTGNNTLDNAENPLDTSTVGGALRYSIETLLTAFPNLRIFILSATWRFWKDDNNEYTEDSNTYLNRLSKTLPEYNAKLKEIAEEYNLPFIDNYNIGISKFNRYQYFPVTDGTHHNETGRRLIASHLAKELY